MLVHSVGKIWGSPVDHPNTPSCRRPVARIRRRIRVRGTAPGRTGLIFDLHDLHEKSVIDVPETMFISRDKYVFVLPQKRRNPDPTVDSHHTGEISGSPVHTGQRLVVEYEFQARLRHATQQPLRLTGTSIAVLDARIKGITAHTFRYASRQHIYTFTFSHSF